MLKLCENGSNIDYLYEFSFEKSYGNCNFGFDLLASVRVFRNRNRTKIRFPHIPINCVKAFLAKSYHVLQLDAYAYPNEADDDDADAVVTDSRPSLHRVPSDYDFPPPPVSQSHRMHRLPHRYLLFKSLFFSCHLTATVGTSRQLWVYYCYYPPTQFHKYIRAFVYNSFTVYSIT